MTEKVTSVARQLVSDLIAAERDSLAWSDIDLSNRLVKTALDRCLSDLTATGIWGSGNRLLSGTFWEIAGDWLGQGQLMRQARVKPRGYAGDYLMLASICENWRCEHPLGRALDDYFQNHAAPQAVRNRTELVAAKLVNDVAESTASEFHVVSWGSGPAIDLERAVASMSVDDRQRLRVVLLDLDPDALAAATKRLLPYLAAEQIAAKRENLFRLPQRRSKFIDWPVEFICCTGFFDYLDEASASTLLRCLWNSLADTGRLIVFNFAPHHPSQALMEWIGNWYLVYRDTEQMQALASAAGIPSGNFTIGAETLGIELFIDARR